MSFTYWKRPDIGIMRKEKVLLAVLLIASFFLFFYKLGAPSLFETDEVIYGQVAREIVRTHDWLTLHLFGKPWFIHPPLYMWLTALSSYIFGITEFSIRLWNAVFSTLLVLATYLLGKKMFRDGVGLLAAFILATSLQVIIQARIATFDPPLVFFMIMSVYFFIYWLEDKLARYYYLSFLSMGFAVLVKGPVGIVLPLLIITAYLAATKNLRAVVNLKLLPGLVIAYLTGGSWYTAEAAVHGRSFIDSVFSFYTFGRYLHPIEAHYAPWYFYLIVITVGFLPWTPFLYHSVKYQWEKRGDPDNLLTVMWLAIVFLFFTAAQTKLPGYVFSFYPFAAISVSKMLSDHFSGEDSGLDVLVRRSFKALAVTAVILMVIGVMFKVFDSPDGFERIFADMNVTFLVLGSGSLVAFLSFFRSKQGIHAVVILVITMLIFALYTASSTMISLDSFKPMKEISQRINSMYTGREMIVGYDVLNRGSIMFYLDRPVIWENDIIALRSVVNEGGDVFIISNARSFPGIGQEFKRPTYLIQKAGDLVLLFKKM